jgi:hypothetical protein
MSQKVKQKRMLGIEHINGKTRISINYSSLNLLQECQRKADYIFNHGLVDLPSQSQIFGTLIHKTLQSWYLVPKEDRTPDFMRNAWFSIASSSNYQDPQDGVKTIDNGAKSLHNYALTFRDDDLEVITLNGKPAVEVTLEATVFSNDTHEVQLFGTIDLIVQSKKSGDIYVMDHKTTSRLGDEFYKLWKPNHQVSAYILLAQLNGIKTNEAVIQGIQTVKTKHDVVRVECRRTPEELQDFVNTLVYEASRFIRQKGKVYPGASDYVCGAFGGCRFQQLCQVSNVLREPMMAIKKREIEEYLNANANAG